VPGVAGTWKGPVTDSVKCDGRQTRAQPAQGFRNTTHGGRPTARGRAAISRERLRAIVKGENLELKEHHQHRWLYQLHAFAVKYPRSARVSGHEASWLVKRKSLCVGGTVEGLTDNSELLWPRT
jgi:hypothetical protein